MAAAFLVGAATALLAVYVYGARAGKPAELERGIVTAYRIDLNHAPRAELMQLPGVGESLARRVEEYRVVHGGFRSVDELMQVHGIGPTTVERLRPWVQVEGAPSIPSAVSERKTSKVDRLDAPIDVNRATREELQRLPGIGPKLSQRIVEERQKGPFRKVEDLRRVAGIGPKTLERLRPYVVVGDAPPVLVRNDS
jgi:competence protein ComEA